MIDKQPGCFSIAAAFFIMIFATLLGENYIITDNQHTFILTACCLWIIFGGYFTNSNENQSTNIMDELANNKKIKYHQNRIKQIDKEMKADTEHRRKTDPEFKKDYDDALEFIDSLGKYGEADYAKPILAFLKKNKGKI